MYRIRVARKLSWSLRRTDQRPPRVGGRREGRRTDEGQSEGRRFFQGKQDIRRQPKEPGEEKKQKTPDAMSIQQIMAALKLDMETTVTPDQTTIKQNQEAARSRTLGPIREELQAKMAENKDCK